MKLNDKKKRRRNNSQYVIEKQYMKDNEKKNFSVFQNRNHENWPTPLQAFANEMMKENKNISTVPVHIKVDNKDWTVNVSTTVVSQSKSSSEFPRNREALFKSLKEESYRLLKLVSKKNSIRNDVRMVFDPNENRITPFHINFKKDNGSSDKCPDNLDMTKFLSSDVEDSDDESNSDISECDVPDSIDSPVSPPNAEFSGVQVTNEAHNFIDEESNKHHTICRHENEVDASLHLTLKQCDINVKERDGQILYTNEHNSCGPVAESGSNPHVGFKNEVNHDVLNERPSQIVGLSKVHDDSQTNGFLEKEVNQNSSNDRTSILCLSDINHLGEEVMVKNELDHQVLPEKVIDEDKDSVVHIEVFGIEQDQQGIITRSEERAETRNIFESEYIIPEIDFVDNSNEPTDDVSESFHADCSNSSYDFESDTGVNLTKNGVSSMHSNDTSQDVSEEAITKTNEELVLLDGELQTTTLQGTDEKDPLSIDGFRGGVLFYDPETDYDNRDIYSSDKNDSCSNENNINLPGNNEKGICDNTKESSGESTDDFNLSNKWNWSNLKKYNSKTVHNDVTKVRNGHCKEHVNKQLKEDELFLGFSDCTDSSSKYSDFVSACSKLGYYDDMVILNQHYEIIPLSKKNKKQDSELSEHGLSKKQSTTVDGDDSNAIIVQKEISEKENQTTQEVKSEVIDNQESGNDSEDVFLGFKSNENYAKLRRKSIEISRMLSKEVSNGKINNDLKLSCKGENVSPFLVVGNDTSNESSIRRGNLVKCKVSSNDVKLIDPSLEQDISLNLNKNTNLSNLSIESKKAASKDNNRRASMESVPKKRGRPKKNQNQSTAVNIFNGTVNRKENINVALKLNVLEKDDESVVSKLDNQSAKESSLPSLIIGNKDKNGSSVVLLNSPSSSLTNVVQGINGSHTKPGVSCDEANETGHHSADDVSLTPNRNVLTCKLDIGLNKELDSNNSLESLLNRRSRPENDHSQSAISSSADKIKSTSEEVIVSPVEEISDAAVKEFKNFENEGSSAVIDPSKCAAQESTPILVINTDHEMKNLRYRDEVEDTSHHSVDNVSVIPVENKENILSAPVKPVFRKGEDRPDENHFKSTASKLTIQCYSTLDLKEENTKDESNHYGNDNNLFVDGLPNCTAKEQFLPVSITSNDDISVSSKSPISNVMSFSQCMNYTQGDNSLHDELKKISHDSELKNSSAPDASSFVTKGNILIGCNASRNNPIHLIASTPTKSSFTLYMNGENNNPSVEESNPYGNEESIINFSADEHNLTSTSYTPEKDGAPIESDNDEKPSFDLKPVDMEDRSEKNMETTNVNGTPLKRKPGRPPKRFQESYHLQRRNSNSFDSSLAISEFGNKSSLLNSSNILKPGTNSCAEQKEVDDKTRNILQFEKKDILETSLKRKPGRPPKRLSQCFQESKQLQRKSSNSFDSSSAISECGNDSHLFNSSSSLKPGTHSCAEQKEVNDKTRNISVVEKEDILETPLKRKRGRPPKHSSLCYQGSNQLQKKSSSIIDSSMSESGNKSLLLNSSTSLECGSLTFSGHNNEDDKSACVLLVENEDISGTPLKKKPGRPPKLLSVGRGEVAHKEINIVSVVNSESPIDSLSESEKKINLFNSSASLKSGIHSCAEQKEVNDKSRNILMVEKEDILETPLKRKRGRPPKHSSLDCQGSNHLQRKSSSIINSSMSESGNKSLLLNSSASLECGSLVFSGRNNEDDKSTCVLLVENEDISETPLKKKPGRPPKLLSVGRGEVAHKEINNVSVVKSESPIDSHLMSNSFSKEEAKIKTEKNLMEREDLQISKPKPDIELTSIITHNKLENVSISIPGKIETKTCSEPVLKKKPGRPPKRLSVSVNDPGFKSDNQENNKIYNDFQLSSNISGLNKLVSSPSTSLESFPLLRHVVNEKPDLKPEDSRLDRNRDILGIPKRKPGRPPKHSLLHLGEIQQCQIEGKTSYINDSGLDTKGSLNNSFSSMFSHESEENVQCKLNDNLLIKKKDCLEPPLKRKPGRPPKCLTMCQQKKQESPINNKNSNLSTNNTNQDQYFIKPVLSQEVAFEELDDTEKNSLERIIERGPDKLPRSLSMSEHEIEECKLENKNVSVKDNEGFYNLKQSEDAEHNLEVEVKNIVEPSLKRKPGRPPKRSTIDLQKIEKLKLGNVNFENISFEDSDKSVINSSILNSSSYLDSLSNIHSKDSADQSRNEKSYFEPPPKRKPGRPPKRSSIGQLEIEKCQIKSINMKDIPVNDRRRSLNNSLLNSYSNEDGLFNVSHSEEIGKNRAVKGEVSYETPLKRKPGRPPKHLPVSQHDINLFKNTNNTNQNVLIANSSVTDYLGPEPKRKPGRPRKLSLELKSCDENSRNNSMHERNQIDIKIENERSVMDDNNSFEVTDGTSLEVSQCVPIRKSGRPRKVSLVLGKSSDASYKLVFERGDIFSAQTPSTESFVNSENTPKRRPGRPKKRNLESEGMGIPQKERSLGNMATSTPLSNQTTSSLSFNSFADLELLDGDNKFDKEIPKKKRGRLPREKKQHRLRDRVYSKTNYTTFNNDDSKLEASKNISIQERVPNIDSSLSLTLNSEDGCDNTVSDESQEKKCLDESELSYKQIERIKKRKILSGRVDLTTRLKNPSDKVKCALCGEIMTVIYYQKQHLLKHNFMSWLEGEEPLPLDDIDKMETLLIRGKRAIPKFVFKCEVCHLEKKSAKGLLSHRQFCGKSDKEREGMMESCRYCGRLMMPASLQPHLYQSHRSEIFQLPDSPPEEPPGPVRKAAAKCLGKIASLIEENSLTKKGGNFHVDGDEEFDEIEEISLLYIPVQKKKTTKHLTNRWKQLAADNKELSCIVPNCTFTTMTVKEMVKHHRSCTADGSQAFSCIKCNYICKVEDEMREHVKSCNPPIMVSQSDNSEDEDHEKHVIIPYLRTAEQSIQLGGRFKSLFFKPALVWMTEIYKKYFTQEPLYPDLHLNIDLWQEMDLQTSQFYNPEKSNSMMISFQNSSWESMHALEGKVIEGNQGIAYTGGPVWGLEWCPGEGPQYLAVSSHLSMEFNFQAGSTFTGPGLVQLWSLEDISNANSDPLTTLQFCYGVCHNERACWNMAWCPSGGRTDTRIGLLALATTSGSIPIYAMPNPECLQYQSTRFYKPEPVLKLELWSNERWQCSAISWSKIKPHNIIAAGFVNGMIAVWNLETQSKLLRKNTILYPFKVFQAHHSIITGVCLSPESDNYLATASYDKSFKYWDLIDTTAPHTVLKRGLFTSVDWLRHWMSAVTTYDNAYTMMQTTVSLSSVRCFVNPSTPVITSINSTAWSISANDWLNGAITSYDNGQVLLFLALRQTNYQHIDKRKFSKVILNSALHNIEAKNGSTESNSKQNEKETLNNNMPSNSYGDAIRKYGLSIKTDPDIGRYDKFQEKGSENMNDIYPLSSINRVAWNPNRNSFLYTAMGYQSGFLVVSKLSFSAKEFNRIEELSKL